MKPIKPLRPLYKVLYHIVFAIAMVLVRLVFPIRTIGKENIGKRGYVFAPNHIHALDGMFVMLAKGFEKKGVLMGKDTLFGKNIFLDFFWAVAGAYPVYRGTGDTGAVQYAIDAVKDGRSTVIFPEGTRTKDGKLGRLKSGAFVIAAQAGASLLPCVVWYKAGTVKLFNRCTIIFGKPVTVEELGISADYKPAELREAKRRYALILEKLYNDNLDKL